MANDKHKKNSPELQEAVEDIRMSRNLHDPYSRAEEAVLSMLEDLTSDG